MRKRIYSMFLMLAMVISCLAPAQVVKAAQTLNYGEFTISEDEIYSFQNASSEWFMNVKSAGTSNGTQINLYPLDMSKPITQRYVFKVIDAGKKVVQISPEPARKMYLDIRFQGGTEAKGKGICLWSDDGKTDKNIVLEFQSDGSFYMTFADCPNYCIGAKSATAAATKQTQLVVCEKTGAAEQRWFLCDKDGVRISPQKTTEQNVQTTQRLGYGIFDITTDKVYTLKNVSSGWFMNIKGAGKEDGTEVNLYEYDMNPPITQRYVFTVMDVKNRVVRIAPEPTRNKYLDIRLRGGIVEPGKQICLWGEDGTINKNLKLELQSDGSFYLTFEKYPEYCIAAQSESAAKTTQMPLVVSKKTGAKEQRWILCDENGKELLSTGFVKVDLKYNYVNDDVHKVTMYYEDNKKGVCSLNNVYEENHTFVNGVCEFCNVKEVYKSPGLYEAKETIPVYNKNNHMVLQSKIVDVIETGEKIEIVDVAVNQYGQYWGKLADGTGYIYMSSEFITSLTSKMHDLYNLILEGNKLVNSEATTPHFTVSGRSSGRITQSGVKSADHGKTVACTNKCFECGLKYILSDETWFRKIFGVVSEEQCPHQAKWSCYAFASFAQWYLYKEGPNDYVKNSEVESGTFTKSAFWDSTTNAPKVNSKGEQVLQVGDHLRLRKYDKESETYSYHSMIVYAVTEKGVKVFDCNGDYHCQVRIDYLWDYTHWSGCKFYIYRVTE